MKLKDIGGMIICGAATYLGFTMMKGIIETCVDPYKRAVFKQKVNNVKEALTKKN